MSHRPLVLVSGLTVGDYLLWDWSLNGNHAVLALVAGLTMPPLAVACLWLLALTVARLAGDTRARRELRGGARRGSSRYTDVHMASADTPVSDPAGEMQSPAGAAVFAGEAPATGSPRRRSRKLAA